MVIRKLVLLVLPAMVLWGCGNVQTAIESEDDSISELASEFSSETLSLEASAPALVESDEVPTDQRWNCYTSSRENGGCMAVCYAAGSPTRSCIGKEYCSASNGNVHCEGWGYSSPSPADR